MPVQYQLERSLIPIRYPEPAMFPNQAAGISNFSTFRGARRPIASTTARGEPFQTLSPVPTEPGWGGVRAAGREPRTGSCSAFAMHEDDWSGRVNWIRTYVKTPRLRRNRQTHMSTSGKKVCSPVRRKIKARRRRGGLGSFLGKLPVATNP
jgi:hypothetical protein